MIQQTKIRRRSISEVLVYLVCFASYIYSSISIIIDINYSDNSLEIFYLIIGLMVFINFIKVIDLSHLKKTEVFTLFTILTIYTLFLLSHGIYGFNDGSFTTLKSFSARSVPAIILGIIIARKNSVKVLIRKADIYILFTTLGLIVIFIKGVVIGVGRTSIFHTFGISAQGISYMAAYTFVLNMYRILHGEGLLPNNLRNILFNLLRVLTLPIQIIIIIYGGGRGAFIVSLFASLYIIYKVFNTKNIKVNMKSIKKVFWGLSFVALGIILMSIISPNFYNAGLSRMTGFISFGQIEWSQTSGRDFVYSNIMSLIKESPLIGHGLMGGMLKENLSAHNFFLEIMVEGGIIYLLLWIFILIAFMRKLFILQKIDRNYTFIFILFMIEFINMQFSAIYLRTTLFWFCLSLVYNLKLKHNFKSI